jgi:diacylglycerol kinase (ATP)
MHAARCAVIANPAAGGGRTGKMLPGLRDRLRPLLGDGETLRCTRRAGEAGDLATQAVRQGARHLVIVGGDGTVHEAVNGVCSGAPELLREVSVSIISTGTGCGLARSLGLPPDLAAQVAIARGVHVRWVDLGRLTLEHGGRSRWFVNECQVGIGAEVVRRATASTKALGGPLTYVLTTLPLLFRYPNQSVVISLETGEGRSMAVTGIAIGNGALTGGGMRLTPRAVLDDGFIDVLVIKGPSILRRLMDMSRVSSGTHVTSPGCDYFQARHVRLSSPGGVPVSADGELVGALPARFECVPRALRVHCPPNR